MKDRNTGSFFSKATLTGILALALLAAGCSASPNQSAPEPASTTPSESVSSAEEQSVSATAPESESESAREETDPAAGTVRTNFDMLYGADLTGALSFSLDLPENWTVDATEYMGMLYDENGLIAQVEMNPRTAAAGQPFTELDEFWPDPLSTKDLTASGCPIKGYVIEVQGDSPDKKTQYLYYISVDGVDAVYPFIWFNVNSGTEGAEEEFDAIVSSFRLAES